MRHLARRRPTPLHRRRVDVSQTVGPAPDLCYCPRRQATAGDSSAEERMGEAVVVGAGPTGLWLAAELRLAGVDVTVVERREERFPHSKGFTIHPRTMEIWASRGIDHLFLDEGRKIPNSHFGLLDQRVDFSTLDTPFPHILVLGQPRVEELLEQYARGLGADIRRGHAFAGLTQDADSVVAQVETAGGRYALEADYLVGCDGAASEVRKAVGIAFPGTDSTAYTWIADVTLDNPPDIPYFQRNSAAGQALVVPMGNGLHRVGGVNATGDGDDDWTRHAGAEELRVRLAAVAGSDFGLRDPLWVSRTGSANRLAERYRSGRVLLAGDAAHRIFPVGGLGLNVGLQDAWNLGWKLAATVRDWAPAGLLDTYHDERHAAGVALMELVRAQTSLMTDFRPDLLALRSVLNRAISDVPAFSASLAKELSGLAVAHPPGGNAHPLTGHRAPDLRLADGRGLFSVLATDRYVLLMASKADAEAASPRTDGGRPPHVLTVVADAPDRVRPEWDRLRAALIRPDGHVAWAAETRDGAALAAEATEAVAAVRRPGA
ncbi:FAD-dependent monooxygenase [Streptomyces sp. NPDC046977]|uniref:FAD-dependent monooxygenase n=1 Tax=Streptomyces sp. NPDC046977 TaxID=3154703 RepID=UPI0033F87F3A